ncbi:MAG: RNA 2',3'-cyclic phosphodiesterase [Chloroflexi bacterium]|nr:RNA 2',3'-cyclic phosphodiesterase [Chloroflexota bacterium]
MSVREGVRVFVAIELPDNVKRGLGSIIEGLRQRSHAPVKWVSADGIHLTLKFLGEIPAPRVEEVKKAVTTACIGTPPMRLEIDTLGGFPDTAQPRVVWAGLSGDIEVLSRLAARVDLALAELGYARESRPFVPHLTVARVRPEASRQAKSELGAAVLAAALPEGLWFDAGAVSLMRSQLRPQGALYTRLSHTPLYQ